MGIGTAIIGPGKSVSGYGIGQYVAREFMNDPMCELKVFVGRNAERVMHLAEDFRRLNPQKPFHGDLLSVDRIHEIFKRSDIDLIVICSPTHTHEKLILGALESGKHVMVEKPLLGSYDTREAMDRTLEKIAVLQKKSGKALVTNCQRSILVPHLRKAFDIPEHVSSISIEMHNKTIDGRLENDEFLLNLLISHPLSILMKFGLKRVADFHIDSVANEQSALSIAVLVNGYFNYVTGRTHFYITLKQAVEYCETILLFKANQNTVKVSLEKNDDNEVQTRLELMTSPHQTLLIPDQLKLFVQQTLNALSKNDLHSLPFSPDESICLYRIQKIVEEYYNEVTSQPKYNV